MAKKTAPFRFTASIAVKIWVDVPIEGDDLNSALAHAKEIKLDRVLSVAQSNGVIDLMPIKITGVYDTEDWTA